MRGVAMNTAIKERPNSRKKERSMLVTDVAPKGRVVRSGKRERVLVEFSESLLKRTDEAASRMGNNRSELIRTAVEKLLEADEKQRLEVELAAGYAANAQMSQELAEEFSFIDREGF
jgi:Arc/MetJ-type ribon-helix-helix transcriptional regulator